MTRFRALLQQVFDKDLAPLVQLFCQNIDKDFTNKRSILTEEIELNFDYFWFVRVSPVFCRFRSIFLKLVFFPYCFIMEIFVFSQISSEIISQEEG